MGYISMQCINIDQQFTNSMMDPRIWKYSRSRVEGPVDLMMNFEG